MTNKPLISALIIIVVVIVIFAIASSKPANNVPVENVQSTKIKIGVIGPYSGDAAVYGEPYREVVQMAIDEINSKGGINGSKIEAIFEDGKCSGQDSASAAQKLINIDKVQVIIGGFCSSESLAIVPIAEQNKVFLLSAGSSSPDLTGISKYFARNYPSDSAQGIVLADVSYNDKGWRKIAFIVEQLDYPLGIYRAYTKEFERLGGKTLKEEFAKGETNFRTIISKLKAESPDALFISVQTPAAAERIVKQIKEADWNISLMVSDSVSGDAEGLKRLAKFYEGALAAEFVADEQSEAFKRLSENYKSRYNKDLPYKSYMATTYDAVYLLKDALEQVGYNGEKIAEWFRTSVKDWKGASGSITIGENGDLVAGHKVKIIRNGKSELYQ